MNLFHKRQHALYIYLRDESGTFWVFDGWQYCRFVWKEEAVWFVRAQAALPAYAVGVCILLNEPERELLEQEAARFNLRLHFYASAEACQQQAGLEAGEPYVFDRTAPAGYFHFGEKMERPFGDQEGES
jgi:hypothetical protein